MSDGDSAAMTPGFAVRVASLEDMTYLMSLQRANRESVGGLPSPAIRERVERGRALLGLLNGEPCGYLLCDFGQDRVLRIPQACIQYDARRKAYGAALVARAFAEFSGEEVRVRCAADLEANLFWRDLGFVCTANVPGGLRRGRMLNLWQLWMTPRLIVPESIGVAPMAQRREDAMYDETDYLTTAPPGFVNGGSLGKLAWANRKGATR